MWKNIFYLNDQGKRKNLEDNIFPQPGNAQLDGRVFIVCDGVGGLSKGEEASRIACEIIGEELTALSGKKITEDDINRAISDAVAAMRAYAEEHESASQMSTTLTLAFIQDNGTWITWCGDSRIFHVRDGQVLWQSKDHSLVQQLVDAGEITQEEAGRHPQRNIILRSLSANSSNTKAESYFISDLLPDDYLLLCTDGVLENIDEPALMDILGPDQKIADKVELFQGYCLNRTSDNYSMYLLQMDAAAAVTAAVPVTAEEPVTTAAPPKKKNYLWLIGLILILIAAAYFFMPGSEKRETIVPQSADAAKIPDTKPSPTGPSEPVKEKPALPVQAPKSQSAAATSGANNSGAKPAVKAKAKADDAKAKADSDTSKPAQVEQHQVPVKSDVPAEAVDEAGKQKSPDEAGKNPKDNSRN